MEKVKSQDVKQKPELMPLRAVCQHCEEKAVFGHVSQLRSLLGRSAAVPFY